MNKWKKERKKERKKEKKKKKKKKERNKERNKQRKKEERLVRVFVFLRITIYSCCCCFLSFRLLSYDPSYPNPIAYGNAIFVVRKKNDI